VSALLNYSMMQNVIKILVITLVLLLGCSQHPRFDTFIAGSAGEALREIIGRGESIEYFSAQPEFRLSGAFGKFSFKGDINYTVDYGWNIKLVGPLRMKLVDIKTQGNHFEVDIPHKGETIEIELDQPIDIPGFDIDLPNSEFLANLLFPIVTINDPNSWKIAHYEIGQPGVLTLINTDSENSDSLVFKLNYSPLRIFKQELWQDNEIVFTRDFKYNSVVNYLPDRTVIKANDLKLDIKYESMDIEFRSTTDKDMREPL